MFLILTSFLENFFFASVKIVLTLSEFNSVHISSKKTSSIKIRFLTLVSKFHNLTIFGELAKQGTNILHNVFIVLVNSMKTIITELQCNILETPTL